MEFFFKQRNVDNWNGRGKNVIEAKKLEHSKRGLIKRKMIGGGKGKIVYSCSTNSDRLIFMRGFYSIYQ